MNTQCECSEEYGPCEEHCEVIAQRAGASSRTADDLAYVFLTDVVGCADDMQRDSEDIAKLRDAVTYWEDETRWDDRHGCRWLAMPDDDLSDPRDALQDDVMAAEHVLSDLGLSVWWEDGYVISRVTGGPLSE